MKYEQVVTSVDQKITEHYVIDGKEYDALLAIRGIGWIAGTAGYEEHVVSITLESGGNMAGRLTIEFPRTKKGEVYAGCWKQHRRVVPPIVSAPMRSDR